MSPSCEQAFSPRTAITRQGPGAQVATFGMSLMQLDIRQESTRHRDVIDAITRHLELGSYTDWPEDKKIAFLLRELRVRDRAVTTGGAKRNGCASAAPLPAWMRQQRG
jgi:Phosphoenolpyruvate carboxylase